MVYLFFLYLQNLRLFKQLQLYSETTSQKISQTDGTNINGHIFISQLSRKSG